MKLNRHDVLLLVSNIIVFSLGVAAISGGEYMAGGLLLVAAISSTFAVMTAFSYGLDRGVEIAREARKAVWGDA